MREILLFIGWFLICLVTSTNVTAQSKAKENSAFGIISNDSNQPEDVFINALEQANMEPYRLRNQSVIIKFREGVTCVLLPASALQKQGMDIRPEDYRENFPEQFHLPLFHLSPDGKLLAEYYSKKRK